MDRGRIHNRTTNKTKGRGSTPRRSLHRQMVDYSDFVEGIRYHADNGLEIPYIPCLDVQVTALPYFKLKCLKCGQISLSCSYMAKHKGCGGYYTVDFATKIYRERAKEKELA